MIPDEPDETGERDEPELPEDEPTPEDEALEARQELDDGDEEDEDEEAPPSRPSAPDFEEEGRNRQRRKLEGMLRESFRRAVEKGVEAGIGAIESGVDVLGKSVEVSRGTIHQASSSLKGVVDEVKLPKDAANYVFGQVDETKKVLIRAVSREVRDFLQGTDLAHELQRALTSLSFEIRTEIRFVPNDKGVMKPEVKSRAVPRGPRRLEDDEPEEPSGRK